MIATDAVLAIAGALALGVRYFASGSNHPGEILGLADAGVDIGVAVHELRAGGAEAIAAAVAANPTIRVFVDSGAFSEVAFEGGVPVVARPISPTEWRWRLELYRQLAALVGEQLYVVAPDCIAHQAETLYRMSAFAAQVQAVAALGANVLVPMQRGELGPGEFWQLAVEALGVPLEQLIPAIPMKKDATSDADLALFIREVRPWAVHLLGLGPSSPRFLDVLGQIPGDIEVMCDSVLVTSLVGRTNGRGGEPRALTEAQDDVAAELADAAFDPECGLDWTDHAGDPSWLSASVRGTLADMGYAAPKPADDAAWADWLTEHGDDPVVEHAVASAWRDFVSGSWSVSVRKRAALGRCLGAP